MNNDLSVNHLATYEYQDQQLVYSSSYDSSILRDRHCLSQFQ